MRKKGLFLAIVLIGILALSSCAGFIRISQEYEKIGINFNDRASILRLEENPALFQLWTNWEPIKLLMTKEEKKTVKKILKIEDEIARNDSSRKFINWFWQRRDGNSYDDVNEFKENFYNRVVEAQERFAIRENAGKMRRCAYGKGWQADLGIIYIVLGEPFSVERHQLRDLVTFLGGIYQESVFMPQEIEVWFYDFSDFDIDEYGGFLFRDGVAWMLFEKDSSGWRFGEKTFSLFFSYENYHQYSFAGPSLNYSVYIGEVYKFIEAVAQSYIYDEDLEFEDFK